MKFFMLRTRMLGIILKILGRRAMGTSLLLSPQSSQPQLSGGVRCLKLASLKLLRSVLSVKDEFYHRHIVQYNLFSPVFDLFREGGTFIGNNLISSAILEMCDFICLENIKSLIDHIVTKHLSMAMNMPTANDTNAHSLEDIANPHVDTFKQMRKAYEDNTKTEEGSGGAGLLHCSGDADPKGSFHDGMQLMMNGRGRSILNKKGLEDQRKFREADEEESYFNEDDDVVVTTEVAMGTTNAAEATAVMCTNTAAAAAAVSGASPEGKVSTTEDVASLMEDVKSLDQ